VTHYQKQITNLLASRKSTGAWLNNYFVRRKAGMCFGEYEAPPGSPSPIAVLFYTCPKDDYRWSRHAADQQILHCSTHHILLMRSNYTDPLLAGFGGQAKLAEKWLDGIVVPFGSVLARWSSCMDSPFWQQCVGDVVYSPEIDCLEFVTKLNETYLSNDERRVIKLISDGCSEGIWERAIIVFTHANDVYYSNTLSRVEQYHEAYKEITGHTRAEIARWTNSSAANSENTEND
jgi:hypothetical protein